MAALRGRQRAQIVRRLVEARRALNLPASTLSERAGLSDAYVKHVESGRIQDPATGCMLAIAKALGVSVGWLLAGERACSRSSGPRRAA